MYNVYRQVKKTYENLEFDQITLRNISLAINAFAVLILKKVCIYYNHISTATAKDILNSRGNWLTTAHSSLLNRGNLGH